MPDNRAAACDQLRRGLFQPCFVDFETEPGRVGGPQIPVLYDRRARQVDHLRQGHAGRGDPFRAFAPCDGRHGHRQMLAEGVVHAAVGDDGDMVGLSQVANLGCCGDAAAPEYVRLEDVHQTFASGGGEWRQVVPVLAGR